MYKYTNIVSNQSVSRGREGLSLSIYICMYTCISALRCLATSLKSVARRIEQQDTEHGRREGGGESGEIWGRRLLVQNDKVKRADGRLPRASAKPSNLATVSLLNQFCSIFAKRLGSQPCYPSKTSLFSMHILNIYVHILYIYLCIYIYVHVWLID